MSVTLDKLRALKRQAGGSLDSPRGRDRDGSILPCADAAASASVARQEHAAAAGDASAPATPALHRDVSSSSACHRDDTARAEARDADAACGAQDSSPSDTRSTRDAATGRAAASGDAEAPIDAAHAPSQCAPPADARDVQRTPSSPTAHLQAQSPTNASRVPANTNASTTPPRTSSTQTIATLRRLLGVRERAPYVPMPRGPVDRSLPGEEIAPGLRLIESRIAFAPPVVALPLAFAKRTDTADPHALMFFDTETTGLAGGTGTRAFMIGAADWFEGELRIRQLLTTTMAAEDAMLREFASWLAPHTVLASYNGRSYDSPLLKTRYRLARLPDPLHALDHVDLLHPTRRRYRGHWENCRLATVERELLKIVREDDLPGSQAPMAWLTYLRGGGSGLLRRVAAHNHQDVVTLARLLLRLVEAEAEAG